ncbi:hypothetical protein PoB_005667300 [Plakobranchus ocellatus]|uniref:Uncharacterized protein n=1 Tax=Plakobranchus ocellatus TaxID=259542 RepID=A0AAV4CF93_9GAST|nr:hypothetical protein PoB_005667300 [Plakobranchus ocellatus]
MKQEVRQGIMGSKGKGSVTQMVSMVLESLVHFREQSQCATWKCHSNVSGGQEAALPEVVQKQKPLLSRWGKIWAKNKLALGFNLW